MRAGRAGRILAAALVLLAVSGGATLIWAVEDLRWRAQVLALIATGRIPDLGLLESLPMLRPGSKYWLRGLLETRNPYASILNPESGPDNVEAGAAAFHANCAGCHGADAHGHERSPALVGRTLTHGDSDWAVYRTIRDGVSGTIMPPHAWQPTRIWQTITYLRSLQAVTQNTTAAEPSKLTRAVSVLSTELATVLEPADDWLTYSGSYSGTRHSTLRQINPDTVIKLAPRWIYQFPPEGDFLEVSPVVRHGVIYAVHLGRVVALDARDGSQIWQFVRPTPPDTRLCCASTTRGLAMLDDKLFFGTADAHLIALSAQDGKRLWDMALVSDYRQGYSITAAPLAYRDLVVTGISGGDYPTRGFIAAFEAATGQERWRFWTIPAPGQPGNETWPGDSWHHGGGATWLTGSYDPKLDLLYWGVGNAAPDFDASGRKGDNLYTNSVVALRGTTGAKVWHFQFTPGDDHDWDSNQIPIIVDRPQARAAHELLWANRNGFFYVLNRENGGFILGAPFVHQTWAERLDDKGRPVRMPGSAPTPKGTLLYPGISGGTHWWPPTYDPDLDLMIVPALERAGVFFSSPGDRPTQGELYLGGATGLATGLESYWAVRAIRPENGSLAWEHRGSSTSGEVHAAGLMSTRGGLVFAANDQLFYALDARDGKLLWAFPTGARIAAAPVTYAVQGTQYVLIASGHSIIAFALVNGAAVSGPPQQCVGADAGYDRCR
jgi:alcohol dehydrogenase (cytochrome c)